MKISLLYNRNDKRIQGLHWKRNNYRFFQEGLPKHPEVEFSQYAIEGGFDCKQLDCDVVILWSLLKKNLEPMGLRGFEDLNCVKITRAPDAWEIDDYYKNLQKIGHRFGGQLPKSKRPIHLS